MPLMVSEANGLLYNGYINSLWILNGFDVLLLKGLFDPILEVFVRIACLLEPPIIQNHYKSGTIFCCDF